MRFIFLIIVVLLPLTGLAQGSQNEQKEWYVWTKDDTRIYVTQLGSSKNPGAPIIVLHGGVGAEYSYLLPAFTPLATKYQFTFFDQRGSLRSPVEPSKITLEAMVDDIETIRNELRAPKIRIVAHSMGALLTYSYLQRFSENVESVIFVDPVFPFYSGVSPDEALFKALDLPSSDKSYMANLERFYRSANEASKRRAQVLIEAKNLNRKNLSGAERTAAWKIKFASSNIFDLSKWEQMRGGEAFYNPSVYQSLITNAGGQESWSHKWDGLFNALVSFKGRTTFIIGKNDFIDPAFQFWPLIALKLPNAKLIGLDHAGHNPWIDQPVKFKKALDSSL